MGTQLRNRQIKTTEMPESQENKKEMRRGRHSSYRKAVESDMGTIQELLTGPIDEKEFQIANTDDKLSILASQFNKINMTFDNELREVNKKLDQKLTQIENSIEDEEGIKTKLAEVESNFLEVQERCTALENQNDTLRREVDILKGVVHRQDIHISSLNNKVTFLTARSMEKNLVISGIEEFRNPVKENCRITVADFLREKMDLNGEPDIKSAYRIGVIVPDKPRQIVIRCTTPMKEWIQKNLGKLKGKRNQLGKGYFITTQLPEQWVENKRILKDEVNRVQNKIDASEAHIPPNERSKVEVKKGRIHINNVPQKTLLQPPTVLQLMDNSDQDYIDDIKVVGSDLKTEKSSVFQAYAVPTRSLNDVRMAYKNIRQSNSAANHVVAVFRCIEGDGFVDDGEHGAGSRLLDKMIEQNYRKKSVFIVRTFGGTHIGPKRFDIMNKLMNQAITRLIHETANLDQEENKEEEEEEIPSSQESQASSQDSQQ